MFAYSNSNLIKLLIPVFSILAGITCYSQSENTNDYETARKEMVTGQIESRGLTDSTLLKALLKVERHKFVPDKYRKHAYEDYPLPIGYDQTISQPYIVALMTELLRLEKNDRVLEIGTGSGYQAALLAEMAGDVYTIEIVEPLAARADSILSELGYKNVTVRAGDGFKGWPDKAPFNAIIVTCAPPEIPAPLLEQLAEGGRLVVPVGSLRQELKLVEKKDGKIKETDIIPVRFVPMTGEGIEEQLHKKKK